MVNIGVVYQLTQAKDLATLIDALHVAHLQRCGEVVTLVGPLLGVTDVRLSPRSHLAYLAGTLVAAHLRAEG